MRIKNRTMEGMIDKYMKCTGGGRGSSSATFTAQEQLQPPNLVRLSSLSFSLIIIYLQKFFDFWDLLLNVFLMIFWGLIKD